jgi:hypothetical protein
MFLPLLLCGLLNIRSTFLPSSEFLGMMAVPATVVAVILVLPFFASVPLLFKSGTSWHRWLFAFVPILMFFLLRDGIMQDVPSVANRFVASHGELTVTVVKKFSRYHGKRCYGGALVSYDGVREARLCRLDESLWHSIAENDTLLLSGSISYFGIDYSTVERARANKRLQPIARRTRSG